MRRALSWILVAAVLHSQDTSWLEANRRTKPNRSEGLMDTPNAKREYTVAAFFALPREPLDAQPRGYLHVKYYLPGDEAVFIQARQMLWRSNYLMISKPESVPKNRQQWNDFSWPAEDVITARRVDASNLGVVVRLNSDNEYAEELAPAVLYNRAEPRQLSGKYELRLKIQQYPLVQLEYKIAIQGLPPTSCY
jgi:hypothetical protein